ncbi:hypothetical protein EAO70_13250 [Streptomyces sp. adm13(2018)]|uniref:hypothetical protein n=1 Tax=Streptomyces sp. adm13(2018) TaxID=2479007 RepID=UPI0011CDC2CF|nr:hypothetical protein [Streptomyces sp. adm13(2018)]TXS16389.1 hypothetical protein EAO70_13250 [Streptomyces sp. adm13(2018)]
MTEQTLTQPAAAAQPDAPAPGQQVQAPGPVPEKPRKSRRPLLRGIARWTAAVLVLAGVGTGTAMGITAMERSEVPGLATESDGRWEYPRLALPALPAGTLRPYTEGNDGEIHHADLRQLLLPAPKGATVDPKLDGGWVGLDTYLAHFHADDRGAVEEALAESALRHVAARGWTTPDGTSTRVYLMRFTSVAFAEAFKDDVLDTGTRGSRLPDGVDGETVDSSLRDARFSYLSLYSFDERKPYGPEQTRWAYIQAGDTLGLVVQSRKGEALAVPFQQTVVLQAQLLG